MCIRDRGYTEEQAVDEANRCLHCKNAPCVGGCPVAIDIPAFIDKVKERDFEGAYQVIARQSSLPAVCGRVCPQETQCEGKCVRGIKGEPVDVYKRQFLKTGERGKAHFSQGERIVRGKGGRGV